MSARRTKSPSQNADGEALASRRLRNIDYRLLFDCCKALLVSTGGRIRCAAQRPDHSEGVKHREDVAGKHQHRDWVDTIKVVRPRAVCGTRYAAVASGTMTGGEGSNLCQACRH